MGTGDMWRDQWYCSDLCSHAAGNRTICDGWNCGCTAYAKLHRVARGLLVGRERLKTELQLRGHEPDVDVEMDMHGCNLPYDGDVHDRLEASDDDDKMDPDREQREQDICANLRADVLAEAASPTALVDAVAAIVNYRESEPVRLELESAHLDLGRKAMQLEDLMSRQL